MLFSLITLFVLLISPTYESSSPITTITPLGELRGYSNGGIARFLGVPYAEPPPRFHIAQHKQPWSGVLDATQFGYSCPQNSTLYGPYDENCLFLNVYAPYPFKLFLPVMVFVHGGSFTSGSGAIYNGTKLAQQDVVVVTINYRLGAAGYLQSQEIKQENPNFPSLGGMNGIVDQLMALEWVKNNIASFGGDHNQVTLFGESAGSLSVCYILTIPRARGLFKQVALESGSCIGPWGAKTAQRGLDYSNLFMSSVGTSSLAGLRLLPLSTLLDSPLWDRVTPSIDNYVVPNSPITNYSTNALSLPSNGAILIGSNSLDTLVGFPWYNGYLPNTTNSYLAALSVYFGNDTASIAAIYPPTGPGGPSVAYQRINAHVCVTCPTRLLTDLVSTQWPVYLYRFSWNSVRVGLAGHFAEVPEVFGEEIYPWPYDDSLSQVMREYWTSFAANGAPLSPSDARRGYDHDLYGYGNDYSYSDDVKWVKYTKNEPQFLDFDDAITLHLGYCSECDFWASYMNSPEHVLNVINYCFQLN